MTKHSPFRYFKTSPEIIRLAVMLYVRFPLSLRNVEALLHEAFSVVDVGCVALSENFLLGFLWGLFGLGYIPYIPYILYSF